MCKTFTVLSNYCFGWSRKTQVSSFWTQVQSYKLYTGCQVSTFGLSNFVSIMRFLMVLSRGFLMCFFFLFKKYQKMRKRWTFKKNHKMRLSACVGSQTNDNTPNPTVTRRAFCLCW
uniref:Uncharacterized protein n=1 Tax=Cacopsylla melanoneura TaxID=428564 RepID=A0A8D8W3P9_9HEMI